MSSGAFIVFEGPDGSGKSTQVKLLTAMLEAQGREVLLTREPGGTLIGEKIRAILLDAENAEMARQTELLLYMASRAQLVSQVLKPAIDAGTIVICDRFVYSSIVYQGYAGGLDPEAITKIGEFATDCLTPDIVFLVDVDAETGLSRINGEFDRMEQQGTAFHRKVRQGFLDLAAAHPRLFNVVDGTQAIEAIQKEIKEYVSRMF